MKMAIREDEITLDINVKKKRFGIPRLRYRQWDKGAQIKINIVDDCEPVTTTGMSAWFYAEIEAGMVEKQMTLSGNTATYTLDTAFSQAIGEVLPYVSLKDSAGNVVASTESFEVEFLEAPDLEGEQAEAMVPRIEQALQTAQDAETTANQAKATAEQAATQATQAVADANEAIAGANAAAIAANNAAITANNAADAALAAASKNVLRGTIGPDTVVTADDALAGVPVAGARVFGATRQNLWSNPSGTNGGITCTSNDDGSLTISGANTTGGDVYLYSDVIESIPYGKQVTFSASNYGVAGEWRFVLSGIGGATPTGQATFTAAKGSPWPGTVAVVVTPGTTVNATVRVMLNEGSEAQPWCPPGLSSVSELSVVSAGKNLSGSKFNNLVNDGVSFSPVSNSEIRISGTGTGNYPQATGTAFKLGPGEYTIRHENISGASNNEYVILYIRNQGADQIASTKRNNPATFTVDEFLATRSFFIVVVAEGNGASHNTTLRWQLELGPSATAYEPPAVTTTPVDLSGHQLRSLPDGTRDVLTVDGSGAVEVEQAVGCVTYDGSSDETGSIYEDQYGHFFHLTLPGNIGGDNPGFDTGVILCDALPVHSTSVGSSKTGIWFSRDYRYVVYVKPPVELASFEDFRSWLAQHPVTVIYPVATQQTTPLDPIAPPSIPAADATLWAASDVPCELEVDYDRDANIVINDLTARIAALEVANV